MFQPCAGDDQIRAEKRESWSDALARSELAAVNPANDGQWGEGSIFAPIEDLGRRGGGAPKKKLHIRTSSCTPRTCRAPPWWRQRLSTDLQPLPFPALPVISCRLLAVRNGCAASHSSNALSRHLKDWYWWMQNSPLHFAYSFYAV